jgi:hypothetical protein
MEWLMVSRWALRNLRSALPTACLMEWLMVYLTE